MLGHAQRALFMVMLCINGNQIMFILWSLANSHDTALHVPAGKGLGSKKTDVGQVVSTATGACHITGVGWNLEATKTI